MKTKTMAEGLLLQWNLELVVSAQLCNVSYKKKMLITCKITCKSRCSYNLLVICFIISSFIWLSSCHMTDNVTVHCTTHKLSYWPVMKAMLHRVSTTMCIL